MANTKKSEIFELPKKLYYRLPDAAIALGENCTVDYLIHLGATGATYLITPLPEVENGWRIYQEEQSELLKGLENLPIASGVIFGELSWTDVSYIEAYGTLRTNWFPAAHDVIRSNLGNRRLEELHIEGLITTEENIKGTVTADNLFISADELENLKKGDSFDSHNRRQRQENPHSDSAKFSTKARNTALIIMAALAKEAKIDWNEPYKAGEIISSAASQLGCPITGKSIAEGWLKEIPIAIQHRSK